METLCDLRPGEGGPFALLQGLYPRPSFTEFDRTLTSDSALKPGSAIDRRRGRDFLTNGKWLLYFWSLFGTALTLGDGIFTPGAYTISHPPVLSEILLEYSSHDSAVSVTSAVGGLAVAKPSIINHITSISVVRFFTLVTLAIPTRYCHISSRQYLLLSSPYSDTARER